MVFKCRMCGGSLTAGEREGVGTCDSCGSTMTLPKTSDERRANLFKRASHLQGIYEFDKAIAAYEVLLNEDDKDAEAHWGIVLCRYGIEYVEDPKTHERIPTCHRLQHVSVLKDPDYLAALECTVDGYVRSLYEREATAIADIQKGILALSSREEAYDVFISYKEQSESGVRTRDSAIAQDLYYQLVQEGYRVFFSRISLEDKLGNAYEPYIFSALNSASVMVVLGTKPEHFNAVWVKNEWSRYMKLVREDRTRVLIPCYRDMDPYDLPEELSLLQSLDMAKIGFMQDLVRGIKKIIEASRKKTSNSGKPNEENTSDIGPRTNPLLERAFIFLEDGEFGRAEEYLERVLDQEPKNAKAYLGKFLAEYHCIDTNYLTMNGQDSWFIDNNNFRKAVAFSQDSQRTEIEGYYKFVQDRVQRELEAERIRIEEEERLRAEEEERQRREQEEIALREKERARIEQEKLREKNEQDRLQRLADEKIRLQKERKQAIRLGIGIGVIFLILYIFSTYGELLLQFFTRS